MKLRYKITAASVALIAVVLASAAIVLSYNTACAPSPTAAGGAATMKAIVYRCYGATDVLKFEDVGKPVVAENEVLVKVHAAAVNPLDWHYMRGEPYIMRVVSGVGKPAEKSMGVDFAGTVEAVGKTVKRFKPGDEVFGGRRGALAEYVAVREAGAIVRKPANVTFEQAAAVPVAAITALQALRDKGRVKPGQKVLINGASGGVGTFAVQIAKSMEAEVTGVCSTRNVEMVRSIGADHVVDYTQEDYTENGVTYDVIVDNVGNHSLLENRKVLNPGGILVMVGAPTGRWIELFINPLTAMLLRPFVEEKFEGILAELNQQDLGVLAKLMQTGELTSVIDKRYPLSESAAAIRHSEQGHARGKIIVAVK